jgi:hypothetical protein
MQYAPARLASPAHSDLGSCLDNPVNPPLEGVYHEM